MCLELRFVGRRTCIRGMHVNIKNKQHSETRDKTLWSCEVASRTTVPRDNQVYVIDTLIIYRLRCDRRRGGMALNICTDLHRAFCVGLLSAHQQLSFFRNAPNRTAAAAAAGSPTGQRDMSTRQTVNAWERSYSYSFGE